MEMSRASSSVAVKFKAQTVQVPVQQDTTAHDLFCAAVEALGIDREMFKVKLLHKGKPLADKAEQLQTVKAGDKLLLLATPYDVIQKAATIKSDPTIRGFDAEDARAAFHLRESAKSDDVPSPWQGPQDSQYRFCRFEPCTWQSFGTRPTSRTPHGFEARKLLVKASSPQVFCTLLWHARSITSPRGQVRWDSASSVEGLVLPYVCFLEFGCMFFEICWRTPAFYSWLKRKANETTH